MHVSKEQLVDMVHLLKKENAELHREITELQQCIDDMRADAYTAFMRGSKARNIEEQEYTNA